MKWLKNLSLILILIFGVTYYPQKPSAFTVTDPAIGGYITWISPCTNPPAINFVTVQSKPPFIGSGSWMFLPGSVPFAYSPPAHPGQPILGKAILSYLPCLTGPVPTGPGGAVVLYTGTGI